MKIMKMKLKLVALLLLLPSLVFADSILTEGRGEGIMGPSLTGKSIPEEASTFIDIMDVKRSQTECYKKLFQQIIGIFGKEKGETNVYLNTNSNSGFFLPWSSLLNSRTQSDYATTRLQYNYDTNRDIEMTVYLINSPDKRDWDKNDSFIHLKVRVEGKEYDFAKFKIPVWAYDKKEIDYKFSFMGEVTGGKLAADNLKLLNGTVSEDSENDYFINWKTKGTTGISIAREELRQCMVNTVFNPVLPNN